MTSKLVTLLIELSVATVVTFLTLPEEERRLRVAQTMQLSARASRRIAESCLRYSIRTENLAVRMVRSDGA